MEYRNIKRIDDVKQAVKDHNQWIRDWDFAYGEFLEAPRENDVRGNADLLYWIERLWDLKQDRRFLKAYQRRAIKQKKPLEGIWVKNVQHKCVHHGMTEHVEVKPESVWAEKYPRVCLKCSENSKKWGKEAFVKEMLKEHGIMTAPKI